MFTARMYIIAAISSNVIDISKAITEDITFPQKKDLINYTTSSIPVPAAIRIPPELLTERQHEQNSTGTVTNVVTKSFKLGFRTI